MDMKLLQEDWDALAGRRKDFTARFYARLFERHPQYRALFPDDLDPQLDRMMEMVCSVVRFADHADMLQPYLVNVGYAHRRLGITAADVENFKTVFIDTLGELCGDAWDRRRAENWQLAFDDLVVPLFDQGLETKASA